VQNLQVCDFSASDTRSFNVSINAAHITVREGNKIVFRRTLGDDTPKQIEDAWFDDKHVAIVDAIRKLEKAVMSAVS
jgi:hypothetical protein